MLFDDGFKYNQDEFSQKVKLYMLYYLKTKQQELTSENSYVIYTSLLIRHVFKKFNILSFDFLNDKTIGIIERTLKQNIEFLVEKGFLYAEPNEKQELYKLFLRKQLFNSDEFSNEFEEDYVLKLMYKIDVLFKYLLVGNVTEYYHTYRTSLVLEKSKKIVKVNISDYKTVKIIALSKKVSLNNLMHVLETENYSKVANYIGLYNDKKKEVIVVPVSKKDDNPEIISKLFIAINIDNKLKKEFEY